MKIRRFGLGAIALVAAGTLALSGCASGGSDDSAGDTAAIITANGSEPENALIPTNTTETGGGKIVDSIFAGLVYYDEQGKPVNDVAESIETDDQQNYTITLKDDQKFSDGTPVTASSFVDAWNYGANLDNAQQSGYFFENIEGYSADEGVETLTGLKVVDDKTFTVALTAPASDWPLRLGYSAFFPLPESAFDDIDAFGQAPVGNGPYMLAGPDAWAHNEQIELVVNPEYNGGRKAQNGGVTFKFYASEDAAYADLLGGNLDILDSIPASSLANYEADLGDRGISQPAAIFQSFSIPDKLEHFGKDEEGALRRAAISMAINRDEITDVIFEGSRTPATDFSSPIIDGWTDELEGEEVLTYNPDEAKKLWAEADAISPWSGSLQISYNSDSSHQVWVDAVTNSIKNTLGIDASGNPYPTFGEFRTAVSDRQIQTAFRTGWQADYPSLYNFLGPLYATGASSNDTDYSNPEVDELLEQGSSDSDPEAAIAAFQQAEDILLKDLPAIPLWYQNITAGYSDTVDDVAFAWNSVPIYYQITKS